MLRAFMRFFYRHTIRSGRPITLDSVRYSLKWVRKQALIKE